MKMIYLDNAATTRMHPEVVHAMLPYFTEIYANPSSVHSFGKKSRVAIEKARALIAQTLQCASGEIYFTGSGTESDNMAVIGCAQALQHKGRHIIISTIEHKAILNAADYLARQGFNVTRVPVDSRGRVILESIERALRPDTILASIMLVNNEVGVVQSITDIARLLRPKGVLLHTDAVQAYGKMPIDVAALGVDLLSVSAHKIHGPKGVGALYLRHGVPMTALLYGGPQESARRPGTENVPGIVGFSLAADQAHREMETRVARMTALRDRFETRLLSVLPDIKINAVNAERVCAISNISFPGVDGTVLLRLLDREGLCVTSGSACNSDTLEPSHVLTAMNISHVLAESSVRFSLSTDTTEAEIDEAVWRVAKAAGLLHGKVRQHKNGGHIS